MRWDVGLQQQQQLQDASVYQYTAEMESRRHQTGSRSQVVTRLFQPSTHPSSLQPTSNSLRAGKWLRKKPRFFKGFFKT